MSKDWNAAYANADTPWDKGYAAPPLREFLRRCPVSGKVLVPGCGLGHDVRLLAEQGADVLGLDLVERAVARAREFPATGRVRFAAGDFCELPPACHRSFDWVVEHTCLCAIEPSLRACYARSVELALRPGGQFLAVFYQNVPDDDGLGPPYPIGDAEIEALFGRAFETVESFIPGETYPSRPVGCESLRRMRLLKGAALDG